MSCRHAPFVDVVNRIVQKRLVLRVHVVHALGCTASVLGPEAETTKRAFKPPTIFEARAKRFLLPNRSPVRLLSHASDSMPFTIDCSRGEVQS